jgi:membrane fusion protein (multidrug efflux system)
VSATPKILVLALAIAACGKGPDPAAGAAGAPGGGMPPMPVEVAAAFTDTVIDAISSTGQIEAVQSIELRPDVEGRITAILVREGTYVGKGTGLFRIDDAELRAQADRARADRDLARQNLDRTRDLLAQNASSPAELERAEAAYRSANASLALLEVRVNRSTVRAPFSGVMGQRFVSLGDYVTTSSRLASLQTVDPERAALTVPERYAAALKRGQKVNFRVAALPGREFTGTVDFVDPVVAMPGRTITVKALVPNRDRSLQAGMFIEARLATATRPSAEDAVLPLQGSTFVWVVKDNKASRRQVELGVRTPGFVEAKTAINAGDMVVVGGQERLQDGAPVNPKVVERKRETVTE